MKEIILVKEGGKIVKKVKWNFDYTLLILLILLLGSLFFMSYHWSKSIAQESAKYKKYLGQKYIISKDTLILVNYSIWRETFTLSNGTKIAYEVVNTSKQVKDEKN